MGKPKDFTGWLANYKRHSKEQLARKLLAEYERLNQVAEHGEMNNCIQLDEQPVEAGIDRTFREQVQEAEKLVEKFDHDLTADDRVFLNAIRVESVPVWRRVIENDLALDAYNQILNSQDRSFLWAMGVDVLTQDFKESYVAKLPLPPAYWPNYHNGRIARFGRLATPYS